MRVENVPEPREYWHNLVIAAYLPYVFDCWISGSYGWCRFTDHDYGSFLDNPEIKELRGWLEEQKGKFFMEQLDQADLETRVTLYIQDPDTAVLFKLTYGGQCLTRIS